MLQIELENSGKKLLPEIDSILRQAISNIKIQ